MASKVMCPVHIMWFGSTVYVCAHPHRKSITIHLHTQTHRNINTSAILWSPLRGQSHYRLFHYETCPSLSSEGSVRPAPATINTPATLSTAIPFNNLFLMQTAAQAYSTTPAMHTDILPIETHWILKLLLFECVQT